MIANLFSIFDPSTNNFLSINWMSNLLNLILSPIIFWLVPSRINIAPIYLRKIIILEIKPLLINKINYINCLILNSLFFYIFLNNFLRLFPYIFPINRHITVTLSLSITFWFRMILFTILKNIYNIFIHLTPQGTPTILIPFIVIIETIRNFIRPITLAIRLSANIIAGHLLITLIRNSTNNIITITIIIILVQSLLILLELAISIIQAYVFSILITLYLREYTT